MIKCPHLGSDILARVGTVAPSALHSSSAVFFRCFDVNNEGDRVRILCVLGGYNPADLLNLRYFEESVPDNVLGDRPHCQLTFRRDKDFG